MMNMLSALAYPFCCMVVLYVAHVLPYVLLLYSPDRLLSCSLGIVVCLELVGTVYKTPELRY